MSTEPETKPDTADEAEGRPLSPGGRLFVTGLAVAVLAFVGWTSVYRP